MSGAIYSGLFRQTTFLSGVENVIEGAASVSGSMSLIPIGQRNILTQGIIRTFNPATLSTTPQLRAVYDYASASLVVIGETSGLGTWPVGNNASFAPNPSLIISGSFLVENDGSTFNQLRGITHIPGNNGLVIGGNLTANPATALGSIIIDRDWNYATNIRNNLTIFSSGMGMTSYEAGASNPWESGFNNVTAPGINLYGYDRTPTTVLRDMSLRGVRFVMDDWNNDPNNYYGKSFQLQVLSNRNIPTNFTNQIALMQFSTKRGIYILGTLEPIGQGQTTIQAAQDITIVSGIQLSDYTPNTATSANDSQILLAARKQIRIAGARDNIPQSQFFLDQVLFFASQSTFPILNRPDYALAVQSGSGNTGTGVFQVGLAALGGGGGGGSALPGGTNYDIQFNQNNTFQGASNLAYAFQYRYNDTTTAGTVNPKVKLTGRLEVGTDVLASGLYAVAFGQSNNTQFPNYNAAKGDYSFIHGAYTEATGTGAHAEGYNTLAEGAYSHAQGNESQANGPYSHAEGYNTRAYGQYSHAEGYSTVANGGFSHTEGYSTMTNGSYSHAEGSGSRANGFASHAEGLFTIASGEGQHAQGKYNLSGSQALWILGDGTSEVDRHNLIEGHTGQVRFSGSLFVQPGQGYLPFESQSAVLTYNPTTGQIQLMNTSSIAVGGGGGSTSPGGVNQNIQFNDNGTFGGATRFNYNSSTGAVSISGSLTASGSSHRVVGNVTISGSTILQLSGVPSTTISSGNNNPQLIVINTSTGQLQRAQFIESDPVFNSFSSSFLPNRLTGSFVTTSSFNNYTSSINSFSASILNFSASILNYTSSVNTTIAGLNNYTQSINNRTGSFVTTSSFNAYTSSINNFSASILNFSSSMLSFTSSVNTTIAGLNNYTQSINNTTSSFVTTSSFNAYTSSINNFSASILNFSSSILNFSASILNYTSSVNATITSLNNYTQSINNKTGSFATTASNAFTGTQVITGSLFVATGSIPFASESVVLTINPTTGRFERMLTSSINANKDGYWIFDSVNKTLFTSGGFSTVQITGSLYVSSSAGGYGNTVTVAKDNTVTGINTIINSTFISSSNIDAPALYIYQANTLARPLNVQGGIGIYISSSSPNGYHQIFGQLAVAPGITGNDASRITFLSGSYEAGMVRKKVTETSTGFIVTSGSNVVHAKSSYSLAGRTIHFPGSQSADYGLTFTVVVQNASSPQGIGTTNFSCANALIEDPTTSVFQFGYLLENIPNGVYKYIYLNMSGSGNAWVCESARYGV
jgi:hypothetical protein